ncbi:hypothetical protein TNCV_317701 [Trichonephila clavipes]|nr:hypothetical protein TNCV_317701 [Trichonephila clavipes]
MQLQAGIEPLNSRRQIHSRILGESQKSELQVLERIQNVQHRDTSLRLLFHIPTSPSNDSPCSYTVLLHILDCPHSRPNYMTSNKAEAIPDELKSCALETIEQKYPANESGFISIFMAYTCQKQTQPTRDGSVGCLMTHWLWGENATNYDG